MKNKGIAREISRTLVRAVAVFYAATLFALGFGVTASYAQEQEVCFPTCDVTDSRFMTVAGGEAFSTLAGQNVTVRFSAKAETTSFNIEIFDGDTGGMDAMGEMHWDRGSTVLMYDLYAEQQLPGGGTVETLIGSYLSTDMPDNEWFVIPVTTGPEAAAPSGNYFYLLKIETTDPIADHVSNFKLKSKGGFVTFGVLEQPFAFVAQYASVADLEIVYPNFDFAECMVDVTACNNNPANFLGTKYDGTFTFFLDVQIPFGETTVKRVQMWDGDLDRGKWDGTEQDTDDPDTVGRPPFAVPSARDEGIATSLLGGTGAPADDSNPNAYLGRFTNRSPSVRYEIYTPTDEFLAANENPSGNREWEKFTISTDLSEAADDHVGFLPPGTYKIVVSGMDMNNLNAWYFEGTTLCIKPNGDPCEDIPRTYTIGDRVWLDEDGDGVQDAGEPGIPAVVVNELAADGSLLETNLTDGNGEYLFDVTPGTYTVEIAPENFGTVVEGAIGDLVWLDDNRNGVQDPGEPGIPNVDLVLYEVGADGLVGTMDDIRVSATETDVNGNYMFKGLAPGTYYRIALSDSIPDGLFLVFGTDPTSTRTITGGETILDLDSGYDQEDTGAAIGDFVWLDLDFDGVQDAGEPGISQVSINLIDTGADAIYGTADDVIVGTQSTAGGYYLFSGLAPGTYVVDVTDVDGVLSGYTMTAGLDPTLEITVGAGDVYLDADFGYYQSGLWAVEDTVWFDANRNGLLDGTEMGIGGVTVNLLDVLGDSIATTTTNAAGYFRFDGLADGAYSLQITDYDRVLSGLSATTIGAARSEHEFTVAGMDVSGINFGYVDVGALEDLLPTTASPTQTNTVVDENILTYDFGYAPVGSCEIGRPVALVFEYTGDACWSPAASENDQGGRPGTSGDYTCSGDLDGDEPIQVVITKKANRLEAVPGDESVYVGGWISFITRDDRTMYPQLDLELWQGNDKLQSIEIHTSCSQPLNVGDQFGSLKLRQFVNQ